MTKNTIHIFLFVKNEIDFINQWILHNYPICDKLTIVDNGSTDGTYEYLNSLQFDNISLIRNTCHFKFKSQIITNLMKSSPCDILLPIDADELIILEDENIRNKDTTRIKKYLSEEIICNRNTKFIVKNIYDKYPNEYGWWDIRDCRKCFFCSQGFISVDTGYHSGKMEDDNIQILSKISYLHYHYRNKTAWQNSTKQKLFARLGEDWDNIEILEQYWGESYHVAKEYVRYKTTNSWHNLKKHIFDTNIEI